MLQQLRSRLTYANVMATIAVFLALGGATFAAIKIPKKSVGTKQLKNGAVTKRKIHTAAVSSKKIVDKAVGTGKIAGSAVTSSKIAGNAVKTADIANEAVTRAKVADSAIPFLGTLRTGQTLRGSFDVGDIGADNSTFDGASFQFPLENTPTAPAANVLDLVANPSAATASCPGVSGGNQQTPNAAGGQLCVYITGKTNLNVTTPVAIVNTSRLGFGLKVSSGAADALYEATGFWAVTAP